MARKPRLHFPGAFYHVMVRGNDGQKIFFEEEDRYRLCLLLQEGICRYGHRIHAFCFMGNHLHFVIQVADVPLSRIVQNFSFRFTRLINRKHGRIGHLFQGRFKAILVDAEKYLLGLVRYIHLNPVRAGLVGATEDYLWSGHKAYLGIEELPWLTSEAVLSQFSQNVDEARHCYRDFVEEGMGEGRRRDFHSGTQGMKCGDLLGDDRFIEELFGRLGKKVEPAVDVGDVIDEVCRFYKITRSALAASGKGRLASEARAVAAWIVREMPETKLMDLSRNVNRDVTSLSSSIERLLIRSERDIHLKARLEKISKKYQIT